MKYFIYIRAHKPYGLLYTGITNDLIRRVYERKEGALSVNREGSNHFCRHREAPSGAVTIHLRYCKVQAAMQYGSLRRACALLTMTGGMKALIKNMNSEWRDLYEDLV